MNIRLIYIVVSIVILVALIFVIGNFIKKQSAVSSVINEPSEMQKLIPKQGATNGSSTLQIEGVAPQEDAQGLPIEVESATEEAIQADANEKLPVEEAVENKSEKKEEIEDLPVE